jgi:ribosome-associated toxin RatA of RatAB toxin-antitoxin module
MAGQRQSYSTTVAASAADCFAVITDFAAYPHWSSPIRATDVRQRYPDGLAKQVEMELDMKIRRIRYVLEYQYEPPARLTWVLVEGDLKAVEGSYVFEEAGQGRTEVTCTQAVDIGFWVPGFLLGLFERQALRDTVEEFKQEVEARQRLG